MRVCGRRPQGANEDHGPDSPLGAQIRERCPIPRFGTPEDFAGIGVYIMSDCSRYHSGDLVKIDAACNHRRSSHGLWLILCEECAARRQI